MKSGNKTANKNVFLVLRFFYGVAWRYKKTYFAYAAVNALVAGFAPFINIMLPKYIIDELLGPRHADMLVRYIGGLVSLNLAVALVRALFSYLRSLYDMLFSNRLKELLVEKAMSMDFEHTESAEMLTRLEKARTGIDWYSGGITGLTDNMTACISGAITFLGTVYIIGRLSPWLFAVLVAVIAINMVFLAKTSRLDNKFIRELVAINRKFIYYFNVLKAFKYG